MMGKGIIVKAHLGRGLFEFPLKPFLILSAEHRASKTFHKSQSTHGLHRLSIARALATRVTRVSPFFRAPDATSPKQPAAQFNRNYDGFRQQGNPPVDQRGYKFKASIHVSVLLS